MLRLRQFVFLALLLSVACQDRDDAPLTSPQSIYGGQPESRWPEVGALIDTTNLNSFCSATLVDAQWVLTAAHCVTEKAASDLLFRVGDDADIPGNDFAVNAIHIYPDYLVAPHLHDVALLHIGGDTSGLTPMPLNVENVDGTEGTSVVYVGYGYDENHESGLKRSAEMGIQTVATAVFTSVWDDGEEIGVCYGDSGGAVLMDVAGELSLAGVISNIIANADAPDPCVGTYSSSRVDRYMSWIRETIGISPVDCNTADGCLCPAACATDGSCDNTLCSTDSCESGYDCLVTCDFGNAACINECYLSLTADDAAALSEFRTCGTESCSDAGDEGVLACMETNCPESFYECFNADDCDILGGDCPTGDACTFGRFSLTFCEPTLDIPLEETCDDSDSENLQCQDGHTCREHYDGPICKRLCYGDEDCPDGETCYDTPAFPTMDEALSYCTVPSAAAKSGGCSCSTVGHTNGASLIALLSALLL